MFDTAHDTIDCALLDLTMPRLRGEECLATLRQRRPDLPVILMSGFSAEELCDRFTNASVTRFLTKPFTSEDLVAAVQEALSTLA